MRASNSIEPRHSLVDFWIVFHGARAEWIHTSVDAVIPAGEPSEVANNVHFTDLRKIGDWFADVASQGSLHVGWGYIQGRQVVSDAPWGAALKDQSFVLIYVWR